MSSADTHDEKLAVGTKIGDLEITGLIANGVSAIVYKAMDLVLEVPRVIKIIKNLTPHAQAQFLEEAKALAKLNSPHIITCFTYGTIKVGVDRLLYPYIVMEYVSGVDLKQYTLIENHDIRKRLDQDVALAIIYSINSALVTAHEKYGIIHGDIKLDNVMLSRNGTVKLIDFGSVQTEFQTISDGLNGTMPYIAPEQFDNSLQVTGKVDIYGLGCILYELLTGIMMFQGSMIKIVCKKDLGEYDKNVLDGTDRKIIALIHQMTSIDPKDRYGASELKTIIEQYFYKKRIYRIEDYLQDQLLSEKKLTFFQMIMTRFVWLPKFMAKS